MNEIVEKECKAMNGEYKGKQATCDGHAYLVDDWGIDSNGCVITYSRNDQSFVSDTDYI